MKRRHWLGIGLVAAFGAVWTAFPRLGMRAKAMYWSYAMGRGEGALEVGDLAPDFELQRRGSPNMVRLSAFRGDRPVALVFGSYT